ncbi:hypothetical protein HPB50_010068 [Hyalomma asiaticum]|uniref:Uncharacterized protein n=1 Tax=Hyalomma asiaticum TaxID=266040 RepID=A0ACB7RTK8_HYAAI|nr:hypothetical protein HPB50_010068 [Hyalomma asiaticum]
MANGNSQWKAAMWSNGYDEFASGFVIQTAFSDFHLTWICMAALLLILSLIFVKGVGDKLSALMVPWILAMVPFILWLVGAAVWAAVNSKMMDPVNATLMFAFALVEAYFLSCAVFYHRVLVREH